jgi:hypothetical protein
MIPEELLVVGLEHIVGSLLLSKLKSKLNLGSQNMMAPNRFDQRIATAIVFSR